MRIIKYAFHKCVKHVVLFLTVHLHVFIRKIDLVIYVCILKKADQYTLLYFYRIITVRCIICITAVVPCQYC